MAVIPSTNVNLATNIRDVLNAAGGSVGSDAASFFASEAKINKWAKFKPESYKKDFDLTESDRYLNDYGLDVTAVSRLSVNSLFDNAKAGNTWAYILPKGGINSPYRVGDFRGYKTDAEPPFSYRYINKSGASVNTTYSTDWRVVKSDNAEIEMSDLEIFDTLSATHYFFILRKGSTYFLSSLVSRAGDPTEIICSLNFPSTGTWEWIFCMGQNLSEDISSRTDVVLMPEGYGTFEFIQTIVFINITYTGGEVVKTSYDKDQYLLTLGDVSPAFSMVASDTTNPITDTVLEFGFKVYLLDSSKNQIAVNSIYSEGDYDQYTFNSSNGTQTKTLIDFPNPIYMKNYFSESDLNSAAYARFYPEANRISGLGIPSNPTTYYDITL